VLTGTESADQPAEETSEERRDHSRNHIGKVRIELCAKSFISQAYDVLARHNFGDPIISLPLYEFGKCDSPHFPWRDCR
jgi:hypothetical protein